MVVLRRFLLCTATRAMVNKCILFHAPVMVFKSHKDELLFCLCWVGQQITIHSNISYGKSGFELNPIHIWHTPDFCILIHNRDNVKGRTKKQYKDQGEKLLKKSHFWVNSVLPNGMRNLQTLWVQQKMKQSVTKMIESKIYEGIWSTIFVGLQLCKIYEPSLLIWCVPQKGFKNLHNFVSSRSLKNKKVLFSVFSQKRRYFYTPLWLKHFIR